MLDNIKFQVILRKAWIINIYVRHTILYLRRRIDKNGESNRITEYIPRTVRTHRAGDSGGRVARNLWSHTTAIQRPFNTYELLNLLPHLSNIIGFGFEGIFQWLLIPLSFLHISCKLRSRYKFKQKFREQTLSCLLNVATKLLRGCYETATSYALRVGYVISSRDQRKSFLGITYKSILANCL